MEVFQGLNNIYGLPPGSVYYGKTPTADVCSNACLTNTSCFSFTWHDQNNPDDWPFKCYFRDVPDWDPTPEANHTSGRKLAPQNVYVTQLSGVPAFTGLRMNGLRGIRARSVA